MRVWDGSRRSRFDGFVFEVKNPFSAWTAELVPRVLELWELEVCDAVPCDEELPPELWLPEELWLPPELPDEEADPPPLEELL